MDKNALATMPGVHSVLLGELRPDAPGDERARRECGGARGEDDPLVGGDGGAVDCEEGGARQEVHGHAEPVADRGAVTLGDQLAPERNACPCHFT